MNSLSSTKSSSALENELVTNDDDERNLIYVDYSVTLRILSTVLNVTVELDILRITAKGGPAGCCQLTAAEIAAQLPANANNRDVTVSMLDSMLRLLAAHSVVTCTLTRNSVGSSSASERRNVLAPAAKYLLHGEDGLSLASGFPLVFHQAFVDSLL